MPLRVVFVTSVFEDIDTGPGIYARYLWNHFRDDPLIDFHVVAPEVGARSRQLLPSGKGKNSWDLYRRLQQRALDLSGKLGPGTIVHGNAAHSMSLFMRYSGPLVVQVNDIELAELPAHWSEVLRRVGHRRLSALIWRRHNERRVVRRADVVLCNSGYTARAVLGAYGIDVDRVRTVRKAVDLRCFTPPGVLPPDPFPQRPRDGRLVFVGTDWSGKGLDVLFRALQSVASRYPNVSLVVVGPPESRANREIRTLAATLGLEERVRFVGRLGRDEVARLLWHSDVAVLPSRREALGVAALEAMAAGLPVVASRTGGIPEVVEDEVCGLLCAPGDLEDLALKLSRVLVSRSLRDELAAGGLRKIEEFSTERMVSEVREVYLSLAERFGSGFGHFSHRPARHVP